MGAQEVWTGRSLSSGNRVEGGLDGRLSLLNCVEGVFNGRLFPMNKGGVDGRLPLVNAADGGVPGEIPFQHRPRATNKTKIKPLIDLHTGQTIALVKPVNSSASGTKRKVEIPIKEGDSVSLTSKAKNLQKLWICDLCQVKATSELGLKEHLMGKKHRAKEKASRKNTKSTSNNLDNSDSLSDVTDKSSQLEVSTGMITSSLDNNVKKNVEADHTKDLGKLNGGSPVDKKQKIIEFKNFNTKFKFWCTVCNVGATSEAQMTAHQTGNKHLASLQENGGADIVINTMPDDVQYLYATMKTAANEEMEVSPGKCNGKVDAVGADKE